MTKEQLEKQLEKVRDRRSALEEREREIAQKLQMAEDEAKMKYIRKYKIPMDKLILINRVSMEDLLELLRRRGTEAEADAEDSSLIKDTISEEAIFDEKEE